MILRGVFSVWVRRGWGGGSDREGGGSVDDIRLLRRPRRDDFFRLFVLTINDKFISS